MPPASLIELVRFGYGPRPGEGHDGAGLDPARLLDQLADAAKPIPRKLLTIRDRLDLLAAQRAAAEAVKAGGARVNEAQKTLRALGVEEVSDWIWDAVMAQNGFAERLVNFWANRLTVAWRKGVGAYFLGPYREEAIRPHIAGRYGDMLAASAWHPAMMEYLDQIASIGPDSELGLKRRKGLNENYAREFLELHTMGAGYTQPDVTELARLFAGMQYDTTGTFFDAARAEPGPKVILGESYATGIGEIARLIGTVARRPETAQSVALALARHFIADDPPPDLVEAMAQAYLGGETALMPVYRALLEHPAAHDPIFHKLRSPHEYMVATLRALDLNSDLATGKGWLKAPQALTAMAQSGYRTPGPDGWPDSAEAWATGPALAARLNWGEALARRFGEKADPAAMARAVLGGGEEATILAAGRAEQRWEGVAVLLGAPAFMRR